MAREKPPTAERPTTSHSGTLGRSDRALPSISLLDLWQQQLIESFWPKAFYGMDLSKKDRDLIRQLVPEELTAFGPRQPRHFTVVARFLIRLEARGVPPEEILGVLMDDRVSVQPFVARWLKHLALPKLGRHLSSLKAYQRQGHRLLISERAHQAIQLDIDRISRARDAAQRYVAHAGRRRGPKRLSQITPQVVRLVRLLIQTRQWSHNEAYRDTATLLNASHGIYTLNAELVRLRYQRAPKASSH